MKRIFVIIILTTSILLLCLKFNLNNSQLLAVTIFSLFIFATLIFWQFRLAFAFLGLAILFFTGVLDVKTFIESANFDIVFFLVAMMIVVGFLEKRGFFDYLLNRVLNFANGNAKLLLFSIMLMSGFLAAMVDEVTSILFMTTITLQLTRKYNVNPIPFVLMIIFATNIGSSASVIGNPIGILIAFKGKLTFFDFLRWATPISFFSLLLCVLICFSYFSKDIRKLNMAFNTDNKKVLEVNIPGNRIKFLWGYVIFTFSILIFHSKIENIFHIEKNTMLLGAVFFSAGLAFLIERKEAKSLIFTVDWWTICFFAFFFASVGALKHTGIIQQTASFLIDIAGSDSNSLFFLFTSASAAFTPIIDNVLVVSIFAPIVESLEAYEINNFPVWWGMLFGGTFLGNLTMIGSTANIVAVGILESKKVGKITILEWIKAGFIVSIPTFLLAVFLLYLQFPLMK